MKRNAGVQPISWKYAFGLTPAIFSIILVIFYIFLCIAGYQGYNLLKIPIYISKTCSNQMIILVGSLYFSAYAAFIICAFAIVINAIISIKINITYFVGSLLCMLFVFYPYYIFISDEKIFIPRSSILLSCSGYPYFLLVPAVIFFCSQYFIIGILKLSTTIMMMKVKNK